MHKMISALLQRKYFVCNIPIPLKANSNEVKINRTLLVCGTGQIKAKCMMYNNCVFLRCNVNHYNAYFCIIHHCNTQTKCLDLYAVPSQAFTWDINYIVRTGILPVWSFTWTIGLCEPPSEKSPMLFWNKIFAVKWGKEPEVSTGK